MRIVPAGYCYSTGGTNPVTWWYELKTQSLDSYLSKEKNNSVRCLLCVLSGKIKHTIW